MKAIRWGYILLASLVALLGAGTLVVIAAPVFDEVVVIGGPTPHDCDGVTPPGQPIPFCCLGGYVYCDGRPVEGAMVRIESAYGAATATTVMDPNGLPRYRMGLSGEPLLVEVGDWITVTASFSGAVATKRYQITPHGQQVDIVLRSLDDWWNPDWKYRRLIPIYYSGGLPAGTVIKVDGLDFDTLVQAGQARSDGQDLRVVRWNGPGQWEEVARVYVSNWDLEFKLTRPISTVTDTSYYLYYGNPNAGVPPAFTLPAGWWVSMYRDKWWEEYVGTWAFSGPMSFTNVCDAPLDHDWRTGDNVDESDEFIGRLYIPQSGTWTFKLYLNDGYELSINGSIVGSSSDYSYNQNRWVEVGSRELKAGWHPVKLRHMWVLCGAWGFAMSGPGFPMQIVPGDYFQQVSQVKTDVTPVSSPESILATIPPIPTIHTIYPRPAVQGRDVITMIGSGADNDEWGGSIQGYRWRTTGRILGTSAQLVISASELPAGTQVISFAVKDDEGDWSPEVATGIEIYAQSPPVAAFRVNPAGGYVTTTFRMDAALSSDYEDPVMALQVRWDFENDGIFDTGWGITKEITHNYTYSGAGIYNVRLEVRDTQGLTDAVVQPVTVTTPYRPTPWLFILYWDGDNDLSYSFQTALTRLEQMANNPAVTIVALVDGSRHGDTVRYQVQPGGQYINGVNRWGMGELNIGSPQTLSEFVLWARNNYPTEHVYLAIADHGRGTTGLAWDNASGEGAFISVAGLRTALQSVSRGGTEPVDVVHYDACLMGMVENAYQVKDYARFLVASQNLGWSLFPYERYAVRVTTGTLPISMAQIVVDEYDRGLSDYPHTISALDLSKVDAVATAVTTLSLALQENIATYQAAISVTLAATQKLDSGDYLTLNNLDEYVDLWDLGNGLEARITNSTVQAAARALKAAVEELVIAERHSSGFYQGHDWDLSRVHGVSIYFPPTRGGWGYQDYVEEQPFAFTAEGQWDEFLKAYFLIGVTPGISPTNPGVPPVLTAGYRVYLPIVERHP